MNLKKINKFSKNFSPPKAEKEYLKLLSYRMDLLSDVWEEKRKLFRKNLLKDIIIFILIGVIVFLSVRRNIELIYTRVDANSGEILGSDKVTRSNMKIGENEIKSFLRRFILDVRTIPMDKNYYNNLLREKNIFLTKNSQGKLNEMIRSDGILNLLSEEKTTMVKISSINVLTNSKNTYQIRWTEDIFERNGEKKESKKYIGIFSIEFTKLNSETEILKNPFEIVIKDFSISNDNN